MSLFRKKKKENKKSTLNFSPLTLAIAPDETFNGTIYYIDKTSILIETPYSEREEITVKVDLHPVYDVDIYLGLTVFDNINLTLRKTMEL